MPAIGGRPAIGGAPETARCGFAAYRSAFGNGTLDSDEIWCGSWPLYGTHSCQVSRQSIMAFVRHDCRNAKPTVRALPIPGSVRRLLFRNGSTDYSQIWQAAGDVPSAGAHQISSRSARPIDFDRSRAPCCPPSSLHGSPAVERRPPASACRSRTPAAIRTKLRRQRQRATRSTPSKFHENRSSRFRMRADRYGTNASAAHHCNDAAKTARLIQIVTSKLADGSLDIDEVWHDCARY